VGGGRASSSFRVGSAYRHHKKLLRPSKKPGLGPGIRVGGGVGERLDTLSVDVLAGIVYLICSFCCRFIIVAGGGGGRSR